MARYDDWDYGEPENRPAAVERHLARIGISLKTSDLIGGTPEPAQTDAREVKERLLRHDRAFGLSGGLGESLYRVSRAHYGVGDPDGRED